MKSLSYDIENSQTTITHYLSMLMDKLEMSVDSDNYAEFDDIISPIGEHIASLEARVTELESTLKRVLETVPSAAEPPKTIVAPQPAGRLHKPQYPRDAVSKTDPKPVKLNKKQQDVFANLIGDLFTIANANGPCQLHYATYSSFKKLGLVEFDHYGHGRVTTKGQHVRAELNKAVTK